MPRGLTLGLPRLAEGNADLSSRTFGLSVAPQQGTEQLASNYPDVARVGHIDQRSEQRVELTLPPGHHPADLTASEIGPSGTLNNS
jgi:hypothetical protein